MSTIVWAVVYNDYENNSTVRIFTTQALAEAHAKQLDGSYDVQAFNVLGRLPQRVNMHGRGGYVLRNGGIRIGTSGSYEYWDDQLPPPVHVDSAAGSTHVVAWATTPEEADRLLIDNIAEQLVQRGHVERVGHWRQHAPDMIRTVQEQGQQ